MPKLLQDDKDMMTGNIGSFTFSGVRPDKLGSTEYTIIRIARDKSSSIAGKEKLINDCLISVVKSCKASPRAESLLLGVVNFGSRVTEEHGFKLLSTIDPDKDYIPAWAGGSTVLIDTCYESVTTIRSYAKTLHGANYLANGICFIITDGEDVGSRMSQSDVRAQIEAVQKSEELERIMGILIGINTHPDPTEKARICASQAKFAQDCGLTGFIDAGDANESNLAKLANFISTSISSQSNSLGTGGPSQLLTI